MIVNVARGGAGLQYIGPGGHVERGDHGVGITDELVTAAARGVGDAGPGIAFRTLLARSPIIARRARRTGFALVALGPDLVPRQGPR